MKTLQALQAQKGIEHDFAPLLKRLRNLDRKQLRRIEQIGTAMIDAVEHMNVTRDEFDLVWAAMRETADGIPG